MYSKIISQNPLSGLVTLDEAKTQCRITHTFDDDFITALIPAAVEMAQSYSRRLLTESVVTVVIESYQKSVLLPFGEATAVTEIELDGVVSTEYTFDEVTQKVTFVDYVTFDKAKITYNCGYTVIPTVVKQAILLTISTLYNNREDFVTGVPVTKMPLTANMLLDVVRYHGI